MKEKQELSIYCKGKLIKKAVSEKLYYGGRLFLGTPWPSSGGFYNYPFADLSSSSNSRCLHLNRHPIHCHYQHDPSPDLKSRKETTLISSLQSLFPSKLTPIWSSSAQYWSQYHLDEGAGIHEAAACRKGTSSFQCCPHHVVIITVIITKIILSVILSLTKPKV